MKGQGHFPPMEPAVLSPLDRFRKIREAAIAAEKAATALEQLRQDDPRIDRALEAFDAACGILLDLICDPSATELINEIEGFLTATYGRIG